MVAHFYANFQFACKWAVSYELLHYTMNVRLTQ